jgi:uncharacterized membrane protein HdeD (DUF308 family)
MSKSETTQKSSKKLLNFVQVILPFLLIALGILLIKQRDALNTVFTAIGAVIALLGLIYAVIYFSTKQYESRPSYLAIGLGLLIIGGILVVIPFLADTFIPFCIGLFVLISGISSFVDAWQIKKVSPNWQIPMLFSILIILMGVAVLLCTFHMSGVVWIVIGVILIASGVMRLINSIISIHSKKKPPIKDVIDVEPEKTTEA